MDLASHSQRHLSYHLDDKPISSFKAYDVCTMTEGDCPTRPSGNDDIICCGGSERRSAPAISYLPRMQAEEGEV
jgi:hypothetical protein